MKKRYLFNGSPLFIAVVVLTALLLSGAWTIGYAEDEEVSQPVTFTKLKLNEKKSFTVKSDNGDGGKYFEIKIPKKGYYKIRTYNSILVDSDMERVSNNIYKSKTDAENGTNEIGLDGDTSGKWEMVIPVHDDPGSACNAYSLKAGVYYIYVWTNEEKNIKTGIKVSKVTDIDLWDTGMSACQYVGIKTAFLTVFKTDLPSRKYVEGRLVSLKTSNKSIATVKKDGVDYVADFKKPGKVKITIRFKGPDGKKRTIVKSIIVKKYPKHIKSLKINGKKIKISKNKYECSLKKYKKKSVSVKMLMKKGWDINESYCTYYTSKGGLKEKGIKANTLKKGSKISFPKKYDQMVLDISTSNNKGESISYTIYIYR